MHGCNCLQLEEERLAVIERDNRMLLEKMSQTMLSGGRVDDKNLYDHKRLVCLALGKLTY